MTSLASKDKWEKTGRENIDILFKVPSSDGKYNFLNPTHEEMVTPIVKEFVRSYKDLPVKVFQTQTKFRNEKELLSLVGKYVTLSIPQYSYISSTYEYVGYEIVK